MLKIMSNMLPLAACIYSSLDPMKITFQYSKKIKM